MRAAADDVAEIELVGALGVVVRSSSHPLAAGANDIELATDGLPSGVYYVRVRSGGSVVGASVVIER